MLKSEFKLQHLHI